MVCALITNDRVARERRARKASSAYLTYLKCEGTRPKKYAVDGREERIGREEALTAL